MRARTLGTIVVAAGMMLAGAGCGSSSKAAVPATGTSTSATTPALSGTVTVLAAASLTGTFTQIGKDFEAAHPGVKVTFSFGASSTLAAQIDQGAPADVFASASPTNMKQVSDVGGVSGTATTFVKNQLAIAVAKGNPLHIMSPPHLTNPALTLLH